VKIRVRLTLFYTFATSVILLVFSLFIYVSMRWLIFQEIDRKLELFADGMTASVRSLAAFNLLDQRLKDLRENDRIGVEVIAPQGEVLFRTETASRVKHNPAGLTTKKTVRFFNYSIETVQKNVAVPEPGRNRHRSVYRVLSKKFFHDGRFIGWVQVAQPVDDTMAELARLKKIIVPGILVFLVIISASGYGLARESLLPIKSIIASAGRISDENLSERIPPPASRDELSVLIATLNRLFDRLETSFRSQKQFISDAAHELKTPLAILRSNLETEAQASGRGRLSGRARSAKRPSAKRLGQNIDTLARLSGLVDKLLLLSRLENGKVPLREERLDFSRLISSVAESAEFLMSGKKQRFSLDLEKDVFVRGDQDLLFQACLNLLSNAAKYTPAKGEIILTLTRSGGKVRVAVKDTGQGMTPDEQAKAFDRFYRADASRSGAQGFGLGLPICRWIAVLHGGTVDLVSEPGKGTEAVLTLPEA
jgi:signal transduction histidine kinase